MLTFRGPPHLHQIILMSLVYLPQIVNDRNAHENAPASRSVTLHAAIRHFCSTVTATEEGGEKAMRRREVHAYCVNLTPLSRLPPSSDETAGDSLTRCQQPFA